MKRTETAFILCYTRTAQESEVYSEKLAYSMHLAYSEDGTSYTPLNDNSGVLFAKAVSNENETLTAKSLKNPYIFELKDGNYGVIAQRTEADGSKDQESVGSVLLFRSSNLIHYEELGQLNVKSDSYVEDAICYYEQERSVYVIHWRDEDGQYYKNTIDDLNLLDHATPPVKAEAFQLQGNKGLVKDANERNVIEIPQKLGTTIKNKLGRIYNHSVHVPKVIEAASLIELENIRATAIYSDGSTANKKVKWDTSAVDWERAGSYEIKGEAYQQFYRFPIASHRADPCMMYFQGSYYFIATDDTTAGNLRFFVRKADTIDGIEHAEEHLILDQNIYPELKMFFWAPEFHIIGDDLYLLFACSSGEFVDIRSQMMKLKPGGEPIKAEDWEKPIPVIKQDGSPLFTDGITLDMTYVEVDGGHYVLWAQRQFKPVDTGSWLYIATIDPIKPWQLTSDPVLISKPEYGWANNHTFVDEGPYAIIDQNYIYMTLSSALVNATYCVGMLRAARGANLLDPASWIKWNYPLLTSRSVEGEFGPGHNSYIEDGEGNLLNVYHARPGLNAPRSTGIRRVHFDIDGEPVLYLTEEEDLNPELRSVASTLVIPER